MRPLALKEQVAGHSGCGVDWHGSVEVYAVELRVGGYDVDDFLGVGDAACDGHADVVVDFVDFFALFVGNEVAHGYSCV